MAVDVNREKYLEIARAEGVEKAVTELHKEMWEIEFQAFEGAAGFQPELVEDLKKFRAFSRELWDLRLQPNSFGGSNLSTGSR